MINVILVSISIIKFKVIHVIKINSNLYWQNNVDPIFAPLYLCTIFILKQNNCINSF